MATTLIICNLALSLCSACVHGLGISLVLVVGRTNVTEDNQRLLIVNLSLCGVLQCLAQFIHDLFVIFSVNRQVRHNIRVVQFTLLTSTYYAIMFAILFDKLAHIVLNIKYPIIVSQSRIFSAMVWAWVISMLVCVPFLTLHIVSDWEPLIPIMIGYVVADILYVLAFVVIYLFIYRKYIQSKIAPARPQNSDRAKTVEACDKRKGVELIKFYRSRFFVASLLVISFVALTILPNFIYVVMHIHQEGGNYDIQGYVLISYQVSWLVDGLIYIFFQPKLRRLLFQTLRRVSGCGSQD